MYSPYILSSSIAYLNSFSIHPYSPSISLTPIVIALSPFIYHLSASSAHPLEPINSLSYSYFFIFDLSTLLSVVFAIFTFSQSPYSSLSSASTKYSLILNPFLFDFYQNLLHSSLYKIYNHYYSLNLNYYDSSNLNPIS